MIRRHSYLIQFITEFNYLTKAKKRLKWNRIKNTVDSDNNQYQTYFGEWKPAQQVGSFMN